MTRPILPPTDSQTMPLHPMQAVLRANMALLAIIALCCLTEAVLQGADWHLWGSPIWRGQAYQYGAFWAGLLHGWQPNYTLQPLLMFLTYPFLHIGALHLFGNMLALFWLGQIAQKRMGTWPFLLLYLISALGGGLGFGLLSGNPVPMTGASGAIFGLLGAWTFWDWQSRQKAGVSLWQATWPTLGILIGLILFNLANWAWQGGMLAWETHLGGFLAGGAFSALWSIYARRLPKTRS